MGGASRPGWCGASTPCAVRCAGAVRVADSGGSGGEQGARELLCVGAPRVWIVMFDALRSSNNSCRSLGRVGTQPTTLPSRVVGARFPFGTVRIAASVSACLWIDSVRGAVFIPAGLAGRAPSQR